jgi:pimeloyl-ACP methyl ester carboxylesterase
MKTDINGHQGQTSPDGLWFRVEGEGPWLILLHGFPSSSSDWADLVPGLARQARVLVHDMLGYGRSAKPGGADYSAAAHLNRLLNLCRSLDIREAAVVGHDLGGILLQQWVHRWATGHSPVDLHGVAFLNSGLYPDLYRPTPLQRLMAWRPLGRVLSRRLGASALQQGVHKVWGRGQPPQAYLEGLWANYSREDGHWLTSDHLQYIAERASGASAWMRRVHEFQRPIALVWGVHDPVSGQRVLDRARRQIRHARVAALPLGHFPQVEAPQAVFDALQPWLADVHSSAR